MKKIGLLLSVIALMAACSPKVQNQEITKLESQQVLLEQTAKLNKLKLNLEKEKNNFNDLTEKASSIKDKAEKSGKAAVESSEKLGKNPGDVKLAAKANKLAKEAASNAKSANKINGQLEKSSSKIKSIEKDVKKIESTLSTLEKKVDFVPAQTN